MPVLSDYLGNRQKADSNKVWNENKTVSGDLVTYVQKNLKMGKNVPHCLKRHLLLGRLEGSGPVSSFSLLILLQKYRHSDPPRCGQEAPQD